MSLHSRLTRLERAFVQESLTGYESEMFVARELASGAKSVLALQRSAETEPWYSPLSWADSIARLVEQGSVRVHRGIARLIDPDLLAEAKDWKSAIQFEVPERH